MIFSQPASIENTYLPDPDLGRKIVICGQEVQIANAPYQLVLKRKDGSTAYSLPVDFYFDTVAADDHLVWIGERNGVVALGDPESGRILKKGFLNMETWQSYQEHLDAYPGLAAMIRHHELGRPETIAAVNILNDHVFHCAISALALREKYLAAGDVSGRITIFYAPDLSVQDQGTVDGAVTRLAFQEDGRLMVNYVDQKGAADPSQLAEVPQAFQCVGKVQLRS
jgi:hypothetical protein